MAAAHLITLACCGKGCGLTPVDVKRPAAVHLRALVPSCAQRLLGHWLLRVPRPQPSHRGHCIMSRHCTCHRNPAPPPTARLRRAATW